MSEADDQDDLRLVEAFHALSPSTPQLVRMRAAVLAVYEMRPSLTAEWLTLLRARPVANTVYACAAAAVLILGAMLSAVPWTLLSEL